MSWPIVRLPPPNPPAQVPWQRQEDARVLGPHTVVTVFTGPVPTVTPRPPHVAPALAQRIEYTRLFEDARCLPAPPVGQGRARALNLYKQASAEAD